MHCSANEILHLVRKSLIGCGVSHDIAEDVGYGCLEAQMRGADCLSELCGMLNLCADHNAENPLRVAAEGAVVSNQRLRLECRGGDLLLRGATICDWLIAHPDTPSVQLRSDRLAGFFVGQLVFLATQYGGAVLIEDTTTAEVWSAEQRIAGHRLGGQFNLSWHSLQSPAAVAGVKWTHSEVDASVWRRLSVFGHRTYVPQSQQSRLCGAGAGLSDND